MVAHQAVVLVLSLVFVNAALAEWPADGVVLCSTCRARGSVIAPDGVGGAFVAWTDERNSPTGSNDDIYMQRVTASGAIAPGWPADGLAVDSDVYAQRMRSDGTRDPGWPVDGLPVTENTALDDFTDLAPDSQGGAYLCWEQYSFATGNLVMIHHLTGAGAVAPGWPAGGRLIPTPIGSTRPHIVSDGMGGAIVAWEDYYERAWAGLHR